MEYGGRAFDCPSRLSGVHQYAVGIAYVEETSCMIGAGHSAAV